VKRITDPEFIYTPAAKTTTTYLEGKFAREYERIAEEKKKADAIKAEAAAKVRKLGGLPK
jgi:hypothetical protein